VRPERWAAGDARSDIIPSRVGCAVMPRMNLKLLIDGLVRQTTVMIAQLSTTSGVRSPLSHVADQVFLQLSRELESQGVSRPVAADMFGMALRTYQKRISRATESGSALGFTLWEAIYSCIRQETPTRARLMERFRQDGEREVASVLHDLVSHGLVYATGQGPHTSYGPTSERMQTQVMEATDLDALVHIVWLRIFEGLKSVKELSSVTGLDEERISAAVAELERRGQVSWNDGSLQASNLRIPVGATTGAEAAMLDHFRAVCNLLVVRCGVFLDRCVTEVAPDVRRQLTEDGGSTFGFSVYPGHPFEGAVNQLLDETRKKTQALWDAVAAYNEQCPPPPGVPKVTFYCGKVTTVRDEHSFDGSAPPR
jgi:hypothetical protein